MSEKKIELVQLLVAGCKSTGEIQQKMKRLFAGTIEQRLEAEMNEYLGYEKNSVAGNNSGNSCNGYEKNIMSYSLDSANNILEKLKQNVQRCTGLCTA